MDKKLKLLHIASFTGNIGDNASHNGLYSLLENYLKSSIDLTTMEIRKAYVNYTKNDAWSWDEELITNINNHDITIIGGGNYFAPWIENSATGTTVNLSLDLIDLIKKPIVFYGVGFDPYTNGYSDNTLNRFSTFIDKITNHSKCLIAVRNDGSKTHLDKLVDKNISSKIDEVPDSGFFVKPKNKVLEQFLDCKYIAINLAKDMIDKRFNSNFTYNEYLDELVKWFNWMKDKYSDFKFILVPHIYSDIEAINDLLKLLPDMLIREKIIIAPHIQGENSEDLFYIYKNAQFSFGNRFHTNVCSICLNTPSIALVTYNKLYDLYDELNLNDRVIIANNGIFSDKLIKLTISTPENKEEITSNYIKLNKNLQLNAELFLEKIKDLLNENR